MIAPLSRIIPVNGGGSIAVVARGGRRWESVGRYIGQTGMVVYSTGMGRELRHYVRVPMQMNNGASSATLFTDRLTERTSESPAPKNCESQFF